MGYEVFDKLCKMRGITAYQVAKETGVSTATLSSWKNGRYTPKDDKLQKLADYLGISVQYLRTGKEAQEFNNEYEFRKTKAIIFAEHMAPGLGFIIDAYLKFDIRDREDMTALARTKLDRYENDKK